MTTFLTIISIIAAIGLYILYYIESRTTDDPKYRTILLFLIAILYYLMIILIHIIYN